MGDLRGGIKQSSDCTPHSYSAGRVWIVLPALLARFCGGADQDAPAPRPLYGDGITGPGPQPAKLQMVFEVVGERPGADLMEAPRTVPLSLALEGITVTCPAPRRWRIDRDRDHDQRLILMAASTLSISERLPTVTRWPSARYRHWPFRCYSSPGACRMLGHPSERAPVD